MSRLGSLLAALLFLACSDSTSGPVDPPAGPLTFDDDWTITGTRAGANLGSTMALIGDVTGDGIIDWATTDYTAEVVELRSGADGTLIRTLARVGGDGDTFGSGLVGGRDLDRDGVPDLAVSAFDDHELAGHVWLFSGATGALIAELPGTVANAGAAKLALVADRDGDGVAELVVGAPADSNSPGSVTVYSGATRARLFAIAAPALAADPGSSFGSAITELDDHDGDGATELAIAAQFAGGRPGAVFVVDGRTGATRATLTPPADISPLGFGFSVATGGDLDGDGRADVLVGCAQCSAGGREESGWAGAYSSATGAMLRRFDGSAPGMTLGAKVADAGDVDADGVPDVASGEAANGVLGPEEPTPGMLRIFSGATGAELHRELGTRVNEAYAGGLVSGDLDGDEVLDLLVGAPGRGPGHAGGVVLLRGVVDEPEVGRP